MQNNKCIIHSPTSSSHIHNQQVEHFPNCTWQNKTRLLDLVFSVGDVGEVNYMELNQ